MASLLVKLASFTRFPLIQLASSPLIQPVRTLKVRHYLRNPSEVKRYRKKCWIASIRTPGRRELVMRKILKGERILAAPGYW